MNKGIYYKTQRLLSVFGQFREQLSDSNRIISLTQLIFFQESTSISSSNMRMCCCCTSC